MSENHQSAELKGKIEALLFASSRPLSVKSLAKILQLETEQMESLLTELSEDLRSPGRGLQLRNLSGRWRLETKPENAEIIVVLKQGRTTKPLSAQALETLAIVALKQPVTTDEINAVRGLNSSGTIQTLEKRKLIGADPVRGGLRQVNHWQTTQRFLDEFGLESLDEIYAAGKLERVFGSVYGLAGSLNNSAQDHGQSQELRSDALKNSAPK